jgi:hypothetical protein
VAGDVLVIATAGDPLTPGELAEDVAGQVGGALAIVFPGFDHVAYGASDGVRFAITRGRGADPGTPRGCAGRFAGSGGGAAE